eukprot:2681124-Pyramimonas_sp.AAC.1
MPKTDPVQWGLVPRNWMSTPLGRAFLSLERGPMADAVMEQLRAHIPPGPVRDDVLRIDAERRAEARGSI